MKKSYLLLIIGVALALVTSCKKKETATPPATPSPAGQVQTMPYTQSFAEEFGTYITKNMVGDQEWVIDFSSAKMAGSEKIDGEWHYYDNEDWLISSPVKIGDVDHAKMTMVYIGRYFYGDINNHLTIWASEDYTTGADPTGATWTQVTAELVEGSNWDDWLTSEISIDAFIGKTVTFAVKYISTTSKAGTIEVQSIAIEEGEAGGGGGGGELQTLPYGQSFAAGFGTYCTRSVVGEQVWSISYSTATMTGHVKVGDEHVYYENDDWLISSPVEISGFDHVMVVVNYAAQYQAPNDRDVTLHVSNNYEFGQDPNTARWDELDATYPNTSNWSTFNEVETSLDAYMGQTVTVAIRFTSTNEKSRTMEIKSITIKDGEPVTPPTPPTPGPGSGSGTADDPYNVAAGIGLQGQNQTAWVVGYIVGAVKSGESHNTVHSNDDIDWAAPFGRATNVLIADDPACNEVTNCLIVKMPSGSALRSQVNLLDHPENLGQQLSVNGTLKNAFGQSGLDSPGSANDFVFEGGTPTPPPTPGTGIFSETFANGQGQFTIYDEVLPSGLNYVWKYDSNRKFMKASAFYNTPYKAVSWLVSPAIEIVDVTTAVMTFEQAINYADPEGRIHVMISTNYTGVVEDAEWTELVFDQWPVNDGNWVFVTSTIDLNAYINQTVTIAFKYTSEADQTMCPTWEVKNVVIDE